MIENDEINEEITIRLQDMIEVIQSIATSDFTTAAKVTSKADVIDALAVGINMLAEELEEGTVGLEYVNKRINEILEVVQKCARGDYSSCETSEENDSFDALCMGINMMIDDIKNNYQELEATQKATLKILADLDKRGKDLEALNKKLQQEIIERKKIENNLRESEERYRDLFENANDLIHSVNAQGKFVYVNRKWTKTLGYSEEELKNLQFTDIIRKDQIPHCMEIFKQIYSGIAMDGVETVFTTKDGREIYVEGSINTRYENGEFVATRGIFRDITERKHAADKLKETMNELERSNKELEQFAYVASHDLQEPLRMISSYLQLLERRYKSQLDAEADEFIEFAVDGAKRLQGLINDLLIFSRVGTRGKKFESTDTEEILDQALSNLGLMIEDSRANVTHDPLPLLQADDVQIGQLFQNLLGNAIKFHGKKPPKVHVTVNKKENEWVFSVQDNGIGMDPKFADRAFMIFQRLNPKEEYPGTGIGLAVCKRIVERHNGKIWFDSTPGSGTTFYFTIPIREVE